MAVSRRADQKPENPGKVYLLKTKLKENFNSKQYGRNRSKAHKLTKNSKAKTHSRKYRK
jgi:hypothetical protein